MKWIRRLLVPLMVCSWPVLAFAADLPAKAAAKAPVVTSPCLQAGPCTGFYVGVNLMGVGSNLDIIGSGINGSVFAGGAMIGGTAGYQLWNGNLFAAIEADADYDMNSNIAIGPASRYFFGEYVKLGIGISNLFTGQVGGSQGPIAIPAALQSSLISPYALVGDVQRPWGSGFASGAGAEFTVGGPWTLDLRYMYVNYHTQINPTTGLSGENLLRLAVNYKF